MTIKEAKERIQRLVDQGLLKAEEGKRRMEDPELLEETVKMIEREKQIKEETHIAISKLESDHTKLLSKQRGAIKVGDLVKLDPLFLKSNLIGLVVEVRKTTHTNYLYIKWLGEEPYHYEISDRLGTKEYYFIKLEKST